LVAFASYEFFSYLGRVHALGIGAFEGKQRVTEFLLENDNRAPLRFFAEAGTQAKAQELVDWIRGCVQS
jgi:hypothetical protein